MDIDIIANTAEENLIVKSVGGLVFANTAEENHIVKSVGGLVFANTANLNLNVKSVGGLVFANTAEENHIVKSVGGLPYVKMIGVIQEQFQNTKDIVCLALLEIHSTPTNQRTEIIKQKKKKSH